jgi:hypothetical protein
VTAVLGETTDASRASNRGGQRSIDSATPGRERSALGTVGRTAHARKRIFGGMARAVLVVVAVPR